MVGIYSSVVKMTLKVGLTPMETTLPFYTFVAQTFRRKNKVELFFHLSFVLSKKSSGGGGGGGGR